MIGTNPFIGARPYGPAEDRMFFGRAKATLRLAEMIDLQPLTIVVSPSGIGKTSLLRAAVMPTLETSGLSPVYLRADPRDGLDACATLLDGRLAQALAEGALLDPMLELRALDLLAKHAPPECTIADAVAWFQALAPADDVRRQLLAPGTAQVERLAVFARFLRGSLAIDALAAYWRRLNPLIADAIKPLTPIRSLRAAVMTAASKNPASLDRELLAPGIEGERDAETVLKRLKLLLKAIPRSDGDVDLTPRIVLVLDQFEQVFTLASQQTRTLAMQMLAEVACAGASFNLVLSLRKEWYADLVRYFGPVVRQSLPLDRYSFHLEPMTRDEASQIMTDCPKAVGAPPIPRDQQDALWGALQTEETVDAVALSIACHELFARPDKSAILHISDIDSLLRAYLTRVLQSVPDDADRDEALDMLGEIAGTSTNRNFVQHNSLLNAPLRDRGRRQRMLAWLQSAFLIRGDNPRQGADKVYDIMHERLLPSVRDLVGNRPDVAAFRAAAQRVAESDATSTRLSWPQCLAILRTWPRVVWDSRSAGIVLDSLIQNFRRDRFDRSALLGERAPERRTDADGAADQRPLMSQGDIDVWWRSRLAELAQATTADGDPSVLPAGRLQALWWLSAHEMAAVVDASVDPEVDELALQSALHGAPWVMRQAIRTLAQRLGGVR
jgi:hypothetical protein